MRSTFRHAAYRGLRLAATASGIIAILGALTAPARAGLTLQFSDGTNTVTFNDGGTDFISVPTTTVGGFKISGSAFDFSTNSTIVTSQATLDITNTSAAVGKTLTITEVVSPTDFSPSGVKAETLKADFAPTFISDNASTTFFSQAVGASSTATTALTTVTTTGDFVKTANFVPTSTGPFTVTSVLTFTPNAVGDRLSDSFTTTLKAVPEPGSLMALATAVPILGLGYRRLRRKAIA